MSITIAVLAVLAAAVGSLETIEAAGAITASGEAMLAQNKASDAWAEYQAAGLKGELYALFGEAGGANAARYRRAGAEQRMRQDQIKPRALERERERDGLLMTSRRHERQHHGLARSATLLEIGIAICTVAIITRRRAFWIGSLGLGVGGLVFLALAYLA